MPNNGIKRCLTFITEGDGDPGLVRAELRSLESRKRDLERTLATAHDDQVIEPHPNMAELYRKKVGELQALLADETARPQAMDWLERNRVGYIFGLATNQVLRTRITDLAEDTALARLDGGDDKVRRFAAFDYAAKSWKVERHVVARVEASALGADSRFIVTNLVGTPQAL